MGRDDRPVAAARRLGTFGITHGGWPAIPVLFALSTASDFETGITREHIAYLPHYQGELSENLGDDAPVVAQLARAAPLTRALFTTLDDEDAPGALLRRLDDRGVTFQSLLDDTCKQRAIRFLIKSDLNNQQIAHLVGEHDPNAYQCSGNGRG